MTIMELVDTIDIILKCFKNNCWIHCAIVFIVKMWICLSM